MRDNGRVRWGRHRHLPSGSSCVGMIRSTIRIRSEHRPMTVCHDCGCECRGYDKGEREWQHSDLFDMECHIHCAVDRMQCPKCGKAFLADVPGAGKGSGFTLLFEAKSLQLMGDMPVNSTARFPNVNDKRLWNVPDRSVEERMKGLDPSHRPGSMWMGPHTGRVTVISPSSPMRIMRSCS